MSNRELAEDKRPSNCRFRLRDEGKAYPRSSCVACGASISTGLGSECNYTKLRPNKVLAEELRRLWEIAKTMNEENYFETSHAFKRIETLLYENIPTIIEALEK